MSLLDIFPKTAVRKFPNGNGKVMLQEKGGKQKEKRYHPTQKPVALMKWCLEKYSKPNDLILTPSSAAAQRALPVKLLGRKWIGIDLMKEYCEIAAKRMKRQVNNTHYLTTKETNNDPT